MLLGLPSYGGKRQLQNSLLAMHSQGGNCLPKLPRFQAKVGDLRLKCCVLAENPKNKTSGRKIASERKLGTSPFFALTEEVLKGILKPPKMNKSDRRSAKNLIDNFIFSN
jgi:hypothetical protein